MMRQFVVAATAAVLLSGCAGQEKLSWYKAGSTSQEFYQARAQCSSMSGPGGQQITPVYGTGFSTGFQQGYNQTSAMLAQQQRQQVFNDCMMGHGFMLTTHQQASRMQQQRKAETSAKSRQSERFWADLERSVPNYREINDDPLFHSWLAERDVVTGRQRQDLLEAAEERRDANAVAAMFQQFIDAQ